jgi:hypothetical protein
MDQHSEPADDRHMIQVFSANAPDLEELRSQLTSDEGEIGPVAEVPRGSMLHFDPKLSEKLYFKVLGVVVSACLPKLINWALAILKHKEPSDPPIIIKVGKRRPVELPAGTDPKVVRALLNDLLKRA